MLAVKLIAVFFMSGSMGVLYRIPRDLLVYASLVGVAAWGAMDRTVALGGNYVLANFFGSVAIGGLSELLARTLKKPATIFIIPGLIPLVPGGDAYTTMLHMVQGHYADGMAAAMRTALIAGAIAFGIFVSSTIYRLAVNYKAESNS